MGRRIPCLRLLALLSAGALLATPAAGQWLRDCYVVAPAPHGIEIDGSLQDWPNTAAVPLVGPGQRPQFQFLWSPDFLLLGLRMRAPQCRPTSWGVLFGGPRLELFFRSRPPESILTSAQLWPPSAVVVDLGSAGVNSYRIDAPVGERLGIIGEPGAYRIAGSELTIEVALPWRVVELEPAAGAFGDFRLAWRDSPEKRVPSHAWPDLPPENATCFYGELVLGGPIALVARARRYHVFQGRQLVLAVRVMASEPVSVSAVASPPEGEPAELTLEPATLPPGESVTEFNTGPLEPGAYKILLKAQLGPDKIVAPPIPVKVLPPEQPGALAAGEAQVRALEPAIAGVCNAVLIRYAVPKALPVNTILELGAPSGWSPAQVRTRSRYGYVAARASGPGELQPLLDAGGARFAVRVQEIQRGQMLTFAYGDSPLGGYLGPVATPEGKPGDAFTLSEVVAAGLKPLAPPDLLAVRVLPGTPRALRVVAPRVTRAKARFALEIWVVDRFGNVTPQFRGPVTLTSEPPGADVPESLNFRPADKGRLSLEEGVTLPAPGTYVFVARARGGALVGRSDPVRCE